MATELANELRTEVKAIFREAWETRDGTVVPEYDDVALANEGVKLDATVLYADLDGSTNLVDSYDPTFAAEIYKTYLHCAAKIIRSEGGVITAYDGDRIMAVYIGDFKNTSAARTALKINYAVQSIINPALKAQYPQTTFELKQVVGIDTSELMATRTGVRGANDLVWVGRAANHAAKLSSLPSTHTSRISDAVFKKIHKSVKFQNGKAVWQSATWTAMSDQTIYRSNWWWRLDFQG